MRLWHRFCWGENGFIESRNTIYVENVDQLVPLESIKLLRDDPNMDSGKNPKGVNEHHMERTFLKQIS